jgi:hemerythrin-like domain-containing protein
MKRDVSLQPLSRQHHDALMACLMIEKGVRKHTDLKILQDFTRQVWENDISRNFTLEENYLVPHLRQNKFPEYILQSLLRDHELLRVLSQRILNGGASYQGFLAFSTLLEQHIRFEERLVFEKAQEMVPEQELMKVGEHFTARSTNICKNYPVKFWE